MTVRAFAPASLSNLGSGVDVLGVAIAGWGDTVTARLASAAGVHLAAVRGDGGRLPTAPESNTCSIAARALLQAAGNRQGVELELDKGLPLASGLGSSAASAAAAVVAVDALLGLGATPTDLLEATLAAEEATCGARHPDNAAPALWGGWVAVRHDHPFEVLSLPCPDHLAFAVARPQLELSTRSMRELLPDAIPFAEARAQWSHLAALVHALHTDDLELLGRSMKDFFAEPRRAGHVPGFAEARRVALERGALSCGLSGSGPSLFALVPTEAGEEVREGLVTALQSASGKPVDSIVSPLPAPGAHVLGPAIPATS